MSSFSQSDSYNCYKPGQSRKMVKRNTQSFKSLTSELTQSIDLIELSDLSDTDFEIDKIQKFLNLDKKVKKKQLEIEE